MELTLKIELAEQDRTLFAGILAELQNRHAGCSECAKTMAHAVESVAAAQPVDVPADVNPFPDPEKPAAEPAPEAKTYTLEDVRKAVMSKSRKGADTKAKVKELLNQYAESVPALPADKYAEFMEKLEAL